MPQADNDGAPLALLESLCIAVPGAMRQADNDVAPWALLESRSIEPLALLRSLAIATFVATTPVARRAESGLPSPMPNDVSLIEPEALQARVRELRRFL
jgi:hypothetical protein